MRWHRHLAVTVTLAKHQGCHQCGDTGIDMHHGSASEVERAFLENEASMAVCDCTCCITDIGIRTIPIPHHMCDGKISEGKPENAKQQHCTEFEPFREATTNQRNGDCRKSQLEHAEHIIRDILP